MTNYTQRDLETHDAIALILRDESGRFLCFYHNKFNFWTVPLGKAEQGQTAEDAAITEAAEECGIEVKELRKLYVGTRVYHREQKKVVAFVHLFDVVSYEGSIRNCEPNKHREMKFLTLDELKALPLSSDATHMLLRFVDEIGWD